eukprot:TRINITY_DN13760_c0_g2_i1.p1 TRINITY_DN13760_c0_g2~~TRINITY_DN13760_c0_g2_i1.p1  ORF type:complete len:382 (+),score=52.64 TRINITY_DN13760_c0_g2_i1:78-1223(+)
MSEGDDALSCEGCAPIAPGRWVKCRSLKAVKGKELPARSGHSLVAIDEDTLLVFGGGPDENVSNDVYRIKLSGKGANQHAACTYLPPDPSTRQPFERDRHSAWVWKGLMYIFGGEDVHGYMDSDIWEFNHDKMRWKECVKMGDTPSPRRGQTCTLVGNTVWLFGGLTFERESVSEIYTLDMNTFTFKLQSTSGPSPCGRRGHSATAINGYLYVFGGCDQRGDPLGDLWRLKLTTCEWEEVDPHTPGKGPLPSVGHAAATFRNMLMIFGGSYKRESCSEIWLWDTERKVWTQLKMKTEPKARSYHALVPKKNGEVLAFGGWSSYHSINDIMCISDDCDGSLKHFSAEYILRMGIPYRTQQKSTLKERRKFLQDCGSLLNELK